MLSIFLHVDGRVYSAILNGYFYLSYTLYTRVFVFELIWKLHDLTVFFSYTFLCLAIVYVVSRFTCLTLSIFRLLYFSAFLFYIVHLYSLRDLWCVFIRHEY